MSGPEGLPSAAASGAPLVTGALLFETSLGAFVVDLFGVDCPVATAELVNLCRCKYFNGCMASEVIPENVMIFSHPVPALRDRTFASLVGRPDTCAAAMRSEWRRMRTHTARLRETKSKSASEGERVRSRWSVGYVPRPACGPGGAGLLLLEPGSGRLLVTLSARRLGDLAERCVLVGAVREGGSVVERMRAAPHQRQRPGTLDAVRPTRIVRMKHVTVLPTAGTPADSAPAVPLAETLRATECFRHWATQRDVCAANATIVQCVRKESGEGFVMLPSHAQGAAEEDIVSVEYNPHYHGEYLSSDDGDGEENGSGNTGALRQEREKRRQAVLHGHQERLNETRALMLNLLDGIADTTGDLRPPENVLFVCKLNPITTGEGLALCFSQFGKVVSADIIADKRTGNSLCYGFIEFEDVDGCFRAFQKMDNALIDDHRIHVDFSQSVSKLWAQRQSEARKRRRTEDA